MLYACFTEAKRIWSYEFGYEMNSLWLNLRMNGISVRALARHRPQHADVEATPLHPPSIASFTMFSESK